jgi:hypothetical protein
VVAGIAIEFAILSEQHYQPATLGTLMVSDLVMVPASIPDSAIVVSISHLDSVKPKTFAAVSIPANVIVTTVMHHQVALVDPLNVIVLRSTPISLNYRFKLLTLATLFMLISKTSSTRSLIRSTNLTHVLLN